MNISAVNRTLKKKALQFNRPCFDLNRDVTIKNCRYQATYIDSYYRDGKTTPTNNWKILMN